MDLTIKLPPEILASITTIEDFLRSVSSPKQEEIKAELSNWEGRFIDVEEIEREIQTKIINIIRKDNKIQELAKQLNRLADNIPKNLKK